MKYLLVATANLEASDLLKASLGDEYAVETIQSAEKALELFTKKRYEFLFVDITLLIQIDVSPDGTINYKKILQTFRRQFPSAEIIILCAQEHIRKAVDAVRAGASNYLVYPIDKKEARYIVDTTLEATRTQHELDYFRDQFWEADSLSIVSTKNEAMKKIFERVKSVAPTDTSVMITGETGTGKGVVAKLIHSHSPRKDMQFISLHSGAIPENLIESELFGHEKGSFTGAVRRKLGKFEIARNGTLFLDEVGTMPLAAQVKLLQVLQDKCFQRVGGEDNIHTDARIIAASNIDLFKMIEKGSFRQDLFYRLNVFPIELPPLRDRIEDIPALADEFLSRLNSRHLKNILSIHPETLQAFAHYPWPGNIRELENLIERAYLLETSSVLTPESFPGEIFASSSVHKEIQVNTAQTLADLRKKSYEDIERNYLKEVLVKFGGRIDASARFAGISTRQLHKLLSRHGIRKEEFKANKVTSLIRN